MTIFPNFTVFKKNFDAGKSQLVWRWVTSDLDTPVSAYLKLAHDKSFSFLLESVEGGAVLGRYSAIGLNPDFYWRYDGGRTQHSSNARFWVPSDQPPLQSLRQAIKESRIEEVDSSLPPMAASGLFGYMGYDMVRLVEDVPDSKPDELGIPEGLKMRPTIMVIFDNVRHMALISTPIRTTAKNSSESAESIYDEAVNKIQETSETLKSQIPSVALQAKTKLQSPLKETSNISREKYHEIVEKAAEYIKAGDIFQVVPSQRFSLPFDLPSFDLYRALRRLNPSPFLFHLNFDDFSLVGSSPEILVRVRDRLVTIRPIAGTRKRGKTPMEDKALGEDLMKDPKERAEHLMLLDLARNDVGRVADIGSVTVTDSFTIEYYSHVMHMVSNVIGKLRDDLDSLDALFAGFPAGTVSGAPKIRAMEIIDELEPVRRSFYGGSVGYLDGHGDIDTCIALRTGLVKDGNLYVQAGGGVVADSDPEFEYQECRNKARALIRAAEMAVEAAEQANQA